ncbi:unnamed protein product [Boreogadus saida]
MTGHPKGPEKGSKGSLDNPRNTVGRSQRGDQPLRSQTNSRPETLGGWCTVPWACESASGLNGTGHGTDRESAASSGNPRAERFSGATNIRDSFSCLTRSRRGRISWSRGNAYKRARGQGLVTMPGSLGSEQGLGPQPPNSRKLLRQCMLTPLPGS